MIYTVTWTAKSNNNNNKGELDFMTLNEAMDFMVLFNDDVVVAITWQEAS